MIDLKPRVGQHVIYVGENRIEYDALVTEVWSEQCINLAVVSRPKGEDTGEMVADKDLHGQAVLFKQSVNLESAYNAMAGRYWKRPRIAE